MRLVLPEEGERLVTIGSTDPGTTNLGLSFLDIDPITLDLVKVRATSYKSERLVEFNDDIAYAHSDRIARICAQGDNLLQQFIENKPFVICSESPFFYRLRPGAFGALMEILFAIRNAAIRYDPMVRFFLYEPSTVKKALGAGFVGKDTVRASVAGNKEIMAALEGSLDDLDEHAIDATCVGYTHLQLMRKEKGL